LQTIKRPIVGADGRARLVLGVATDVTQRKLAEDSLQMRTQQILVHQVALHELTLATLPDLDSALQRISEVAARALGGARVGVWLASEGRDEFHCHWLHQDGAPPRGGGARIETNRYPAYFAALEAQHVIAASSPWTDPRTRELIEVHLRPQRIASL